MEEDLSAKPNDAYFKAVFSDLEHATAFFHQHLPSKLAAHIDWETFALMPGSFVKRSLQQAHADLLFSASVGGRKILLYLLFEHQTTVDPTMPLRMLAYVLEILLAHEKQNGLPLPVVIPFVLHQGPDTWTVDPRFEKLIDLPEEVAADLLPYVPKFSHALLDLTQYDPAREEHDGQVRVILQLMKLARGKQLLAFFHWLVKENVHPLPITLLGLSLMYALHADNRLDLQEIYHTLEDNPELKEQTMSIAERLIAQGKAQGKAEGEAQGKARGELEGKLRLLQELMTLPVATAEELDGLELAVLQARYQELQRQYDVQFKR